MIWALYANHTVSMLLGTLKVFGFASLLIILAKPQMVLKNHYIEKIHELSGFSQEPFLILISGVLVVFIIAQQAINLACLLLDLRLTQGLVRRCSIAMYNHYMSQPYEAMIKSGVTLAIGKNIKVTGQVITTEITKTKTLFSVLINGTLLTIALLVIATFAASVTLIFVLLFLSFFFVRNRKKVRHLGEMQHKKNIQNIKMLREGAAGATELMTMGKKTDFVNRIQELMVSLVKNKVQMKIRTEIPKLLLYATSILLLYAAATITILNDASHVLPTLALFGAAAFRLQNMLQGLFSALMTQEGIRYSYQVIIKDLKEAKKMLDKEKELSGQPSALIRIRNEVTFESVSYSYPGTQAPVIDELSVSLPTKKIIVLSGKSGAGKTTFVRLLSGLLIPQKGRILIDGESLHQDEAFKRAWQKSFGITFQKPFFMDSTLAMNIAFEAEKKKIDYERIREAVNLAQLEELVAELPNGVDTELLEDAAILSGGQRQRVAIARSLYRGVPVLVLDEATNAIDLMTERAIISTVSKTNKDKLVVIISHRMEIMKFADMVLFMKKDKSITQGSVEQLLQQDEEFRNMISSTTAKAS